MHLVGFTVEIKRRHYMENNSVCPPVFPVVIQSVCLPICLSLC